MGADKNYIFIKKLEGILSRLGNSKALLKDLETKAQEKIANTLLELRFLIEAKLS